MGGQPRRVLTAGHFSGIDGEPGGDEYGLRDTESAVPTLLKWLATSTGTGSATSEDLTISSEQIDVSCFFRNQTGAPIPTRIAFPVPEWDEEMKTIQTVNYILKSGANWKGPIRKFKLMLVKQSPKDKISVCLPETRKTSPTTYVVGKETPCLCIFCKAAIKARRSCACTAKQTCTGS
jgi:hypothetical protein